MHHSHRARIRHRPAVIAGETSLARHHGDRELAALAEPELFVQADRVGVSRDDV